MVYYKTLIVIVLFLIGCSSTVIQYPSVCVDNEPNCKRNLNAQTLSIIGQPKAALKLMCEDYSLRNAIGEQCTSE